jgi:hypothetical protein
MGMSLGSLDPFGMMGGGGESRSAANEQEKWQTYALDYLKESDALPTEYREAALTQMAQMYGISGTAQEQAGAQQGMIDRAQGSPLYGAMMGGQQAGEESIMRNAAATGGLRSGNTQEALYDYNVQLQQNALAQSYGQQMQGLQGLASQPSLALPIAQSMSGIGATRAGGMMGGAQSQQAGLGMGMKTGLGVANLFI